MEDNVISLEQIYEEFRIRDKQIERVRAATETQKKMYQAKSQKEYDSITLPPEYLEFGENAYFHMSHHISGYALKDKDNSIKCFYGALGAPASLLIPTVFRGEIRDYGDTAGYSSLGRFLLKSRKKNEEQFQYLDFLVAQMRIMLFGGFLSHFKQFREFPFGTPRPELIAQHYGLDTQFLDLTDDIKVAMFFACCKHIGNNKFRPITEEDIGVMGKYGVLYSGIADIPCIGCQPFCRCHRQRGYYIDTASFGPCWEYTINKCFSKNYFERTVELSEMLYDEFKGGATIFPQDELSEFAEQILQIKESKSFPFHVFDVQYDWFYRYIDALYEAKIISNSLYSTLHNKETVRTILESEGYLFQEQVPIAISEQQRLFLDNNNEKWNPETFADEDGIVFSPLMVRYVDN